jgi:hypothetical protein
MILVICDDYRVMKGGVSKIGSKCEVFVDAVYSDVQSVIHLPALNKQRTSVFSTNLTLVNRRGDCLMIPVADRILVQFFSVASPRHEFNDGQQVH